MKKEGFVYGFLIWFIAFLVGIIIAYYIRPYIPINNLATNIILLSLYYGLIIELTSKVMQYFVFNRKIRFNVHLLFWIIIQSIVFWISSSIVKNVNWLDMLMTFGYYGLRYETYIRFILIALIQFALVWIIWKMNIEYKLITGRNRKVVGWVLIIILLIIIAYSLKGGINLNLSTKDFVCDTTSYAYGRGIYNCTNGITKIEDYVQSTNIDDYIKKANTCETANEKIKTEICNSNCKIIGKGLYSFECDQKQNREGYIFCYCK